MSIINKIKRNLKNFKRAILLIMGKSKVNKGLKLENDDKFREAVQFYSDQIDAENDNYMKAFYFMRKGICLTKISDDEKAIENLKRANNYALEVGDDSLISNTYLILGDLLRRKDKNRSIENYKKALKRSEENEATGSAHLGIGEIKKDEDKYEKAEKRINKALEFFDEDNFVERRDALNKLKEVYEEAGNQEKLDKVIKRIEKLKKEN